MKTLKRCLAALLAVCTVAATLALPALAGRAISTITVAMQTPVAGETVAACEPVFAEAGVELASIEWYDAETGAELTQEGGERFEAGRQYQMYLFVGQKPGYEFEAEQDMTATVNGASAYVGYSGADDERRVDFAFTAAATPKTVTQVDFTLDAPRAGAFPRGDLVKTTAEAVESCYVVWEETDTGDDSLPEGFEAGKAYTARIQFELKTGFAMPEKLGNVRATVNGKPATVSAYPASNVVWIASYDFPELGADANGFPFLDVPDSAWYRQDVETAHKNGLVNGKTADRFAPDDPMTYAEAVKLACAMHQLYHDKKVTLTNGDGLWYETYMRYALEKGIIHEDLTAVANEQIDRRDFVKIFYAALPASEYAVKNDVGDGKIPDVPAAAEAAEAIYAFYRAGILVGSDAAGTFHPDSQIKRGEVAAILTRMFDSGARKSIALR